MASAGITGDGSTLLLDWAFLNARTRNGQEVQALRTVEAAAAQLVALHGQAMRVQQVVTDQQAVWQQLLCCQRAELMCLIPLAGERMQDLAHTSAQLQHSKHTAQNALRTAAATVQMYVNVNHSTADELALEQGAAHLATSKRELASYEESVLARLSALLSNSMLSAAVPHGSNPQRTSTALAIPQGTRQGTSSLSQGPASHNNRAQATLIRTAAEGPVPHPAVIGTLNSHAPAHTQHSGRPGAITGHKRPLPASDNQHQFSEAAGVKNDPQQQQHAHGSAQQTAQGVDPDACKTCSLQGHAGKSAPSQASQEQHQQHPQHNGSSGNLGTDPATGSQRLVLDQQQPQQPPSSAQAAAGVTVVPVTPLACLFQGHIVVEQQPLQFIEQMQQQLQHHQHRNQQQHYAQQLQTWSYQHQADQDTHSKCQSQN